MEKLHREGLPTSAFVSLIPKAPRRARLAEQTNAEELETPAPCRNRANH